MRLLVTRPEPDASETAAQLSALGHRVILAPMLEIDFAAPPVGLATPAAILVTSKNALRALLRWPQATGWLDLPVYAVGTESAALAAHSGFRDVRVGLGTAAGLVDIVAADFAGNGGSVLYPAARNRAGAVDEGLAARGVRIRTVEAYRAIAARRLPETAEAELRAGRIDGALFYSRRTAAAFRDATLEARIPIAGLACYAISEDAAEPLRRCEGARIEVAPRPESDAILGLLPKRG